MAFLEISDEEIRDPVRFYGRTDELLMRAGLTRQQERMLWEWRAHVLRKASSPAKLFKYIIRNTGSCREVTGEDEKEAGLALQQVRRTMCGGSS